MNEPQVTRVRIEARGPSEESVLRCLHSLWDAYADVLGIFEVEGDEGLQVQRTKTGFWGRLTMKLVE